MLILKRFSLVSILTTFFWPLNLSANYERPFYPYYSQIGQDKFLNEHVFKNKKNGVFVDIGAHDGISFSNSYYFEKELGWTGICVEPNPNIYSSLKKNRKCLAINGCAYDTNGFVNFLTVNGPSEMLSGIYDEYDIRHIKRIHHEISKLGGSLEIINIESFTLNKLLADNNLEKIDFLSLDTEGSEWKILKNFDFEKFKVKIICLENNYEDKKIHNLLLNKGFQLIHQISTDFFYKNSKYDENF